MKVCRTFIQVVLANLIYIYPYCHLLQGPFILCTLAAHYCNVHGTVKVPSLGDHDGLSNQPYGALALSTAAAMFFLHHTT